MSLHDLFNYLWNTNLEIIFKDIVLPIFGIACLVISFGAILFLIAWMINLYREQKKWREEVGNKKRMKYPY